VRNLRASQGIPSSRQLHSADATSAETFKTTLKTDHNLLASLAGIGDLAVDTDVKPDPHSASAADDFRGARRAILYDGHAGAVLPANDPASWTMLAEESEELVVAVRGVAVEVFSQVHTSLECTTHYADGDRIPAGATVLTVTGDGRSMLQGERVALNFLQRLS